MFEGIETERLEDLYRTLMVDAGLLASVYHFSENGSSGRKLAASLQSKAAKVRREIKRRRRLTESSDDAIINPS